MCAGVGCDRIGWREGDVRVWVRKRKGRGWKRNKEEIGKGGEDGERTKKRERKRERVRVRLKRNNQSSHNSSRLQ